MNNFLKTLGVLFVTLLLQVLLFRFGVFFGGKGMIFFHLYGLVLFPIGLNRTGYLFLGAVTGALLDLVLLTGGLHMAAGTALGMILPHLASVIAPRDGFVKGHVINALKDGWRTFVLYSFLVSVIYSSVLFAIEGGRMGLVLSALWKGLLSGFLNLVLMVLAQGLFGIKRNNKKSKVSAYPWS